MASNQFNTAKSFTDLEKAIKREYELKTMLLKKASKLIAEIKKKHSKLVNVKDLRVEISNNNDVNVFAKILPSAETNDNSMLATAVINIDNVKGVYLTDGASVLKYVAL